jgi:hypothetical protein
MSADKLLAMPGHSGLQFIGNYLPDDMALKSQKPEFINNSTRTLIIRIKEISTKMGS